MTYEPLWNAGLAIQLHAWSAFLAFVLGGIVLFRRKGDRLHRLGGRIWVGLMLSVCISSFFIHTLRVWGIWSPGHLVSIATLYFLAQGVSQAWLKRIAEHRRAMQQTYLGALVVAGTFTFLPDRVMFEVFFGGPQPWIGVAVALAIVGVSGWMTWRGMAPPTRKQPKMLALP
ncbi:MAG TPA: DUF2306 domain-containing protein, partial [Rhizobiaceae bacterium]|nr:DUF2306 domain-containing protein [Rhizobiaceae bacterium]